MLMARLEPRLRERFPELRTFYSSERPNSLVIPAKHPEFGDIEIDDDGNELTMFIGKFTHCHLDGYGESSSEDQRADIAVERAVDLLDRIFRDQIVCWGSNQASGGFFDREARSESARQPEGPLYVWSGPYGAA